MRKNFEPKANPNLETYSDPGLEQVVNRLSQRLERDTLIQQTTNQLRNLLQVDRVVLYYFYRQWKGQVTFESLSSSKFSIFGSTGPDECFNDEYAAMYEAGRVRAIADIEVEPIHPCHREFLRSMRVRANLVVPILNSSGLWGLLVAHHCQMARSWLPSEIEAMQESAEKLAAAPSIQSALL
ncbi:GAF domain-containing protein [Leptolyngbya sp. FACHB-671]|uniref:GAF domain-containing protein n=1 Tax=Leptolyngbya sp. FACHB-671 TaxID=2692812 RepID=UPI001683D198|nr:GAF domain-containing protein [Leptolyngbya sp. FACHB-671]